MFSVSVSPPHFVALVKRKNCDLTSPSTSETVLAHFTSRGDHQSLRPRDGRPSVSLRTTRFALLRSAHRRIVEPMRAPRSVALACALPLGAFACEPEPVPLPENMHLIGKCSF